MTLHESYLLENKNFMILKNFSQKTIKTYYQKAFKELEPLVAIHQIMEHVLPPHFQKSRKDGLHHHTFKSTHSIPDAIRRERFTVRTLFQIITEFPFLHRFRSTWNACYRIDYLC